MLDTLSSGRYFLGGVDVSTVSEAGLIDIRKGNVGFIFQNFMLIDDLSVHENVELPLVSLKMPANRASSASTRGARARRPFAQGET